MANKFSLDIGQAVKTDKAYYKIIQFLGSGGNSIVYLVLATSGIFRGNFFALKVFRKLSMQRRLERFLEEIKFLGTCEHPAVMKIYDEGTFENTEGKFPLVIAEYLPKTLFQFLKSNITFIEKISCTVQLLSALSYLESQSTQVVHRDIKPQNIFIKGRSCVLGDFGLMKKLSEYNDEYDREFITESLSSGPGMPQKYRTPDLVNYARNGTPITVKSDVFQLGLVIAELFTGKNPSKDYKNILDPVELEPLGFITGKLGGDIAKSIRKMLTSDPLLRPAATDLLRPWEIYFDQAAQASHVLGGSAFE